MDATGAPGRKEVCAALTGVVKRSPLKKDIDPKTFFMLLTSNFQVLFRDGVLDLNLVWNALAESREPATLHGLFLKFEEAGIKLGVRVQQPPSIESLSQADRQAAIDAFDNPPKALPLDALVPEIPPERAQHIVAAVGQCVRASPAESLISSTKLQYGVGQNLSQMCDGQTFNFQPLREALLEVDGIQDPTIYNVYLRLTEELLKLDVQVQPLEFDVDPDTRAMVQQEIAENPTPDQYSVETGIAPVRPSAPPPAPLKIPKPSTQKARLKELGLSGQKERRRFNVVTLSLQVIILASLIVVGWLIQPMRDIDHKGYDKVVPLKRAVIKNGTWVGVLDVDRWQDIPVKRRKSALAELTAILQEEKKLKGASIVDHEGRLCIWPTRESGLTASLEMLYWGTPEGEKYKRKPKSKRNARGKNKAKGKDKAKGKAPTPKKPAPAPAPAKPSAGK